MNVNEPAPTRRAHRGQARAEFVRLVSLETDDCVIWPFNTLRGYGRLKWGNSPRWAHRVALELRVGPPPESNMDAAHGPCHNRRCINYRHLRWASRSENMADTLRDDTHRRGARNVSAKLTDDEVRAIRASSSSETELAVEFGISASLAGLIRRRKRWSWLP